MNDKAQNQAAKWLKITIEVGILLFAMAIAWTTLKGRVERATIDIEKHDTRITHVEKGVSEVKSDIREIKVEQKYISKGIDEIQEKLK